MLSWLGALCSGGMLGRTAYSPSRCTSWKREVSMRNGIPAAQALDQANLRSRISEPRPLGTGLHTSCHSGPKAGLPRSPSLDWLSRICPVAGCSRLGLALFPFLFPPRRQSLCSGSPGYLGTRGLGRRRPESDRRTAQGPQELLLREFR